MANLLMNGVETSNSDKQQIDTSPPATDEQIKAGQDTKQKTVEEDANPKTRSSSDSQALRAHRSFVKLNYHPLI